MIKCRFRKRKKKSFKVSVAFISSVTLFILKNFIPKLMLCDLLRSYFNPLFTIMIILHTLKVRQHQRIWNNDFSTCHINSIITYMRWTFPKSKLIIEKLIDEPQSIRAWQDGLENNFNSKPEIGLCSNKGGANKHIQLGRNQILVQCLSLVHFSYVVHF